MPEVLYHVEGNGIWPDTELNEACRWNVMVLYTYHEAIPKPKVKRKWVAFRFFLFDLPFFLLSRVFPFYFGAML